MNKISNNYSYRQQNIQFTGLNRTLGKIAYHSVYSIEQQVDNFPNSRGIVGNLPKEWIDRIPQQVRGEKIKTLYRDFNLAMKGFAASKDTKKAAAGLNEALFKAGITADNNQLTLNYLDKGSFGRVYRIKGVSDDNLVIKVFKHAAPLRFGDESGLFSVHGKHAEINRAAYWQKHAGKDTQMVRFYFGDVEAGYMVNRYLGKNSSPPKKVVNPEVYGLLTQDVGEGINGANKINGYQVDYGGISVINTELLKDKRLQMLCRKVLAAPAKIRPQVYDKIVKDADSKTKDVAYAILDCLPKGERRACLHLKVQSEHSGFFAKFKKFLGLD